MTDNLGNLKTQVNTNKEKIESIQKQEILQEELEAQHYR